MTRNDAGYADPVEYPTKRLAAVLGKDLTGRILGVLMHRPNLSASEIAGILDIHIATAQKYLLEMKDAGLVECRTRRSPTRPTDEYWLSRNKVHIEVDLRPAKASSPSTSDLEKMANSILIMQDEKVRVAVDADEKRKTVSEIMVLKEGGANTSVSKRIKLTGEEARFAYQLMSSDGKRMSVTELAKKADIDKSQFPKILKLVDKLSDIGYVGASTKDSKTGKGGRK